MIANEREYHITSGEAKRFEEALAQIDDHVTELHPLLQRAMRESLASELQILREQLAEFEARRHRQRGTGRTWSGKLPARPICPHARYGRSWIHSSILSATRWHGANRLASAASAPLPRSSIAGAKASTRAPARR